MSVLDRFRLDGRTAVVTGASSGIGEAIAVAFAGAGARVYAVARRRERLAALAGAHSGIVAWVADLAVEEQCEQLVEAVVDAAGTVDLLVNNAGISNIARAQDETTADFHRVVDLNLTAAFILSRDAARAMIAAGRGGSIVNVSSTAGIVGSGDLPQASYAASKAGLVNLGRELAVQWARHRIRVNTLAPGWVDTDMTGEYLRTERGRAALERLTPLRRAARPDEVAAAALFLASDASSFVTGAVLPVDGGWTAA